MAHVRLKKIRRISNKAKGVKKEKFKSSVSSRIRVTGSGKFRLTQANKAHGMIKHSSRQKDAQTGTVIAGKSVSNIIKRFFRINPKSIKS